MVLVLILAQNSYNFRRFSFGLAPIRKVISLTKQIIPKKKNYFDGVFRYNIQATILSIQIEENIVNEVMRRMVGTAHRIALKLSHAKIAQLLPVVGTYLPGPFFLSSLSPSLLFPLPSSSLPLYFLNLPLSRLSCPYLHYVGLAIGAGGNYAFARETTNYGMMVLRKRWLMQKYPFYFSLFPSFHTKKKKVHLLPIRGREKGKSFISLCFIYFDVQ